MTKTTTKRVTITEHDLAEAMPLGVPMDTRAVKVALGMEHSETRPVATALTTLGKTGFVTMTERSNRANLWTRVKEPTQEQITKAKASPKRDVDTMVVRGQRISLPKMPGLSGDG